MKNEYVDLIVFHDMAGWYGWKKNVKKTFERPLNETISNVIKFSHFCAQLVKEL